MDKNYSLLSRNMKSNELWIGSFILLFVGLIAHLNLQYKLKEKIVSCSSRKGRDNPAYYITEKIDSLWLAESWPI